MSFTLERYKGSDKEEVLNYFNTYFNNFKHSYTQMIRDTDFNRHKLSYVSFGEHIIYGPFTLRVEIQYISTLTKRVDLIFLLYKNGGSIALSNFIFSVVPLSVERNRKINYLKDKICTQQKIT